MPIILFRRDPAAIAAVYRGIAERNRRAAAARKHRRERRARRLRTVRGWLAGPCGLTRGGALVLAAGVLAGRPLTVFLVAHRAGLVIADWVLAGLVALLALRLAWLWSHRG